MSDPNTKEVSETSSGAGGKNEGEPKTEKELKKEAAKAAKLARFEAKKAKEAALKAQQASAEKQEVIRIQVTKNNLQLYKLLLFDFQTKLSFDYLHPNPRILSSFLFCKTNILKKKDYLLEGLMFENFF